MKAVLRSIFRARQRHQALPLYEFMRDDSIPARSRLAFYPSLALFVVALDDLARYVVRDERSQEKYQQLVNARAWEGANRWHAYLEDLSNLGFDQYGSTSDVLRAVFSEENRVGRMLGARLSHLVYGAAPIERLVIMEAIESAGSVLFHQAARLAAEMRSERHVALRHLCDFDFRRILGGNDRESRDRWLEEIHLDDSGRARCMTHVEAVFQLFHEWSDELLAFAVTQPGDDYGEEMAIDDCHLPPGLRVRRSAGGAMTE